MTELVSALTQLASGRRDKVRVAFVERALELCLWRRGERVLVSCYGTDSAPEVLVLDRPVDIGDALRLCVDVTLEDAADEADPVARQITARLAERALTALAERAPSVPREPIQRKGSTRQGKGPDALAFAFDVALHPPTRATTSASRADIHALLFEGTLSAVVRGKRVILARGPVMLAVRKMVAAVRALLEARDAGRPLNLRLRAGRFQIAARTDADNEVTLTLGGEAAPPVTATALGVAEVAQPILRLASEILRALVEVDRSQSRNLRVSSLREEVRELRRMVTRRKRQSVVNEDTELLRLDMAAPTAPRVSAAALAPARAPRFSERWSLALDGLDAASTFLCGDRLVVNTAHHTVALDRDSGEVLWAREGASAALFVAGDTLLRASADGEIELCSGLDGEPFAHARTSPRSFAAPTLLPVWGAKLPSLAVLVEERRLVALDLRTGEPVWRFATRGAVELTRTGRILLVTSGEGSVHALDLTTGDELWRFAREARFVAPASVSGERAFFVSQGGEDGPGALYGVDLYSGEHALRVPLEAPATGGPHALEGCVLVATGLEGATLSAYSLDGELLFCVADPGVSAGAGFLHVDDALIVNSAAGTLSALCLATGETRWSRVVADPGRDDVPRRLTPTLRGGALFLPSAAVHVIRPHDGEPLGAGLPSALIPDALCIDERGWVYVAEESGHVAAYAPVTHLSLIRGGG